MDILTIVLGVITIISFVIGIISFVGYLRDRKYPKKLNFYILDRVKIASPNEKLGEKIKITYNEQTIEGGVSYFKGLFVSAGREDANLKCDSTNDNIKVCLPPSCKWLEVRKAEQSEGLDLDIRIDEENPNCMVVKGGLFKKNELFSFDGFYEGKISNPQSASDIVSIKHRISNTGEIVAEEMPIAEYAYRKKERIGLAIITLITALCVAGMVILTAKQKSINFQRIGEAKESIYSVQACSSDSIEIRRGDDTFGKSTQICSLQEFNANYEAVIKSTSADIIGKWTIVGLFSVVLLFLIVLNVVLFYKGKTMRDIKEAYNAILCNSSTMN